MSAIGVVVVDGLRVVRMLNAAVANILACNFSDGTQMSTLRTPVEVGARGAQNVQGSFQPLVDLPRVVRLGTSDPAKARAYIRSMSLLRGRELSMDRVDGALPPGAYRASAWKDLREVKYRNSVWIAHMHPWTSM